MSNWNENLVIDNFYEFELGESLNIEILFIENVVFLKYESIQYHNCSIKHNRYSFIKIKK
jgi:hypothetical protein